MAALIDRSEGRRLFGEDAAGYDRGRPAYPNRIYELLVERCGLSTGCATLEIGAGSGQVTRRLAELGADPLVAIEPDPRFAKALSDLSHELGHRGASRIEVRSEPFERATLRPQSFDLVAAATSFHWIEPRAGLAHVAECLAPGGWFAMWWIVFGDPRRPDAFHEATQHLVAPLASSPSQPDRAQLPFSLDRPAREAELRHSGAFGEIGFEQIAWTSIQTPAEVRALYATFSSITRLEANPRQRLLDALEEVATTRFGGEVRRNFLAPIYLARRN